MNKLALTRIPRRRGICLLPNLFTTVAMLSGICSMVASMRGDCIAAMRVLALLTIDTARTLLAIGVLHGVSCAAPSVYGRALHQRCRLRHVRARAGA